MMPHIIVEYSSNLISKLDITTLVQELHTSLDGRYNVTRDRVKTRAIKIDDYCVGTDGLSGEMIHITLKLMTGRTVEARKELGQILASVTTKYISAKTSLTVEIVELDKETYYT